MTEHEGIQTFMDCPDRKNTDLGELCKYHYGRLYCKDQCERNDCPRGYQR